LKILSRITPLTAGYVEIHGRVGSLLEVGTGFNPELTGRENIYLNAAILGMKKAEIKRKFDEIVAFAEVERFIDTPVKRYSSGMQMRLAFAVAAHLEPDILLLDEVLAVGDVEFQKKCLGKVRGMAKGHGRTVIFVSHNLQAVQGLCDRGLFLSGGRVVFDGRAQDAVQHYLDYVHHGGTRRFEADPDRDGDGALRIENVYTSDEHGAAQNDFVAGEPLIIHVEYARHRWCKGIQLGLTIFNQLGVACTHINTHNVDFSLDEVAERGHVVCNIPRNPFPVGEYIVSVIISTDDGVADELPGCLSFRVVSSQFFHSTRLQEPDLINCPVMVDHQWRHIRG
jgi:lipopolysaccharide transport system ATP-binding protein